MEKLSLTFVLIIAFLVPGLLATYGFGLHYPPIGKLFGAPNSAPDAPSVVTLSILALGCGVVVNAVTWATIRPLILRTGIERKPIDYSRLNKDNIDVFRLLFEEHYRYYQAYANMLTSIILASISELLYRQVLEFPALIAVMSVCIVLFCAARNALERTFNDLSKLLAPEESATLIQGVALMADSALPQSTHSKTTLREGTKGELDSAQPGASSGHLGSRPSAR
jgi:hypothetical protein